VSKFNFSVSDWSKPCHVPVHKTSCSATGPQSNIYWPVNDKMGAIRMRVTMKFQSSFLKLFTKHLRQYGVPFIQFWFQIKFTPITGELFILCYSVHSNNRWIIHTMLLWVYIHTGQAWKICLTTAVSGPQNGRRSRVHKTHCLSQ
jgi:hypothetical protein